MPDWNVTAKRMGWKKRCFRCGKLVPFTYKVKGSRGLYGGGCRGVVGGAYDDRLNCYQFLDLRGKVYQYRAFHDQDAEIAIAEATTYLNRRIEDREYVS